MKGNVKRMFHFNKIAKLILLTSQLLVLASCASPTSISKRDSTSIPEIIRPSSLPSSNMATETAEPEEIVDNSHLTQLPEKVEDVYEQGKLSLIIDAQVIPVEQDKVYKWSSANYNIADENFQKKMADRLLQGSYSKEANANGGNKYISDVGVLSFNPDINHTSYRATTSVELDRTMENYVSDEGLDNKYVEEVNSILSDLGISHFVPALCTKYGNTENGLFYEIVCQPLIEGLPIVNSGVQPSSFEDIPPYEEILACIGEDEELLLLNFRSSQVDEKTKRETEILSLEEALNILKHKGMAVLSRPLADSESLTVQLINLAYAHLPVGGGFELTPIWLFSMEKVDNSGNISNVKFAVNAVTGEIV